MDTSKLKVLGCNAPKLREISNAELATYTKTKAIVIKFPKDTNLKNMVRIIGSYEFDSDGDSGSGDNVQQPDSSVDPKPTMFDTDVTSILTVDKTRARFVVILRDPQFSFMQNGDAITAGDAAGEKMFVNLRLGYTAAGKPKAVFQCLRDGNNPLVGSFNIGIIIADSGYHLPIVIDPKVQNRG